MDLSYSKDELAFRSQVKTFLAARLPDDIRDKVAGEKDLTKQDYERWHKILNDQGWLAESWPVEYGGTGWGPVERYIFEEECAAAYAPRVVPFGVAMLAPVLLKFGTDAQRAYYLPKILDGTHWWCQGYSEPGAGSDLASLKMKAVRDGDTYVLDGQKTWTTMGHFADHIFCLVRTSNGDRPQTGISFVLVDMATPGIDVRPIRLIEGGHEVNEVFFTGVRIPVENLVGEENGGWTVAKYLLSHERTNIAGVGMSVKAFERLKKLAGEVQRDGKPLSENPLFAARMAEVETDLEAMRITNLRMLVRAQKQGTPGLEASMLKIKGTVIRQAITDLTRRALGPAAAPFPSEELAANAALVRGEYQRAAASYFNNRKLSVFGGSNEIQRNILSKSILAKSAPVKRTPAKRTPGLG